MSDSDKMTTPGGYVDQALAALGGDDADFMVTAKIDTELLGAGREPRATLRLSCSVNGCKWGYLVGQMELWELVADAREHFEKDHAPPAPVKAGGE